MAFLLFVDESHEVASLKLPKNSVTRPVLIYAGNIEQCVLDSEHFDRVVNVLDYSS